MGGGSNSSIIIFWVLTSPQCNGSLDMGSKVKYFFLKINFCFNLYGFIYYSSTSFYCWCFNIFFFLFWTLSIQNPEKDEENLIQYLQSFSLAPTFNLVSSFSNGHSWWQEDQQGSPWQSHIKGLQLFFWKVFSLIFLPPWFTEVWTCFHA